MSTINNLSEFSRLSRWRKNRDAISGQDAVKAGGERYLPNDSPDDTDRYKRYLERALFLDLARSTHNGLLGAIFSRPEKVTFPSRMEYLLEDADGAGESLTQIAMLAVSECLKVGAGLFLVDCPSRESIRTMAEDADNTYSPRLCFYPIESVADWEMSKDTGTWEISELVLIEGDNQSKNFKHRKLALDNEGYYYQQLENDAPVYPTDANGRKLRFIPVSVFGAERNNLNYQPAPLSGIVDINITHYQVSADKYKNLHIHSGGLLVIASDMTNEEFIAQNPNGIVVGADKGVFVGSGGRAEILQLSASDALSAEISSLQEQAVMIGARLIMDRGSNETAEAARIQASASSSALMVLVANVSEAIEKALEFCAVFLGVDTDEVFFRLNDTFYTESPDSAVMSLMAEYQSRGILSVSNIRDYLRKVGVVPHDTTDEMIDKQVTEEDTASGNNDVDMA